MTHMGSVEQEQVCVRVCVCACARTRMCLCTHMCVYPEAINNRVILNLHNKLSKFATFQNAKKQFYPFT